MCKATEKNSAPNHQYLYSLYDIDFVLWFDLHVHIPNIPQCKPCNRYCINFNSFFFSVQADNRTLNGYIKKILKKMLVHTKILLKYELGCIEASVRWFHLNKVIQTLVRVVALLTLPYFLLLSFVV